MSKSWNAGLVDCLGRQGSLEFEANFAKFQSLGLTWFRNEQNETHYRMNANQIPKCRQRSIEDTRRFSRTDQELALESQEVARAETLPRPPCLGCLVNILSQPRRERKLSHVVFCYLVYLESSLW